MGVEPKNNFNKNEIHRNYHQLLFINMALLMGYFGCFVGLIFVGNFILNTEHWINLILGMLVLLFMPAVIYLASKEKKQTQNEIEKLKEE